MQRILHTVKKNEELDLRKFSRAYFHMANNNDNDDDE